jgi:hypothetical protein
MRQCSYHRSSAVSNCSRLFRHSAAMPLPPYSAFREINLFRERAAGLACDERRGCRPGPLHSGRSRRVAYRNSSAQQNDRTPYMITQPTRKLIGSALP